MWQAQIENLTESNPFLATIVWGRSVGQILAAILFFFVALTALKLFQTALSAKLENRLARENDNEASFDKVLLEALAKIHWPFFFLASLYFTLDILAVDGLLKRAFHYGWLIAIIYYVARFLEGVLDYSVRRMMARQGGNMNDAGAIRFVGSVSKLVLWVVAILFFFSNLGYNISSLLTGLGLGGLAVALAVQNVLSDLLSSLAIYFDKPFKVGDNVGLDNGSQLQIGQVRKIGIRTTRIRLLSGEELVVTNSELSKIRIKNYDKIKKRRVFMNIGVAYQTPTKKLRRLPGLIKNIIEKQDETEVDRINFKTLGDFSLIYEVVYFVNFKSYRNFLDIQEAVNLGVLEAFEKEGVEVAFPTQTVHLKK